MNIRKFIKYNRKKILLFISIIVLLLTIIGLWYNQLAFIDKYIYNLIIKTKSPFFTFFFQCITFFASIEWFITLGIFVLLFYRKGNFKYVMVIYMICISLITFLMKNLFGRTRPHDLMIIEEIGYSFPSGHSSCAMAFYGLIAYLIFKSDLAKKKKKILIIGLLILIFLIGVSRIYLGVHYPSDVLAGFMVGIIYLIVFAYIYDIEKRYK